MKQKLFTLFAAVIIAANAMAQTTQEGHEYVDLGLTSGTLWATYNVGATSPEEYGDYFAWGETSPKKDSDGNYTEYSWSTYKYCKGSSSTLTKYCTDSSKGTVDNKTTLDPEDDAAHVNWGGDWRMPTKAEQDELRTECTWSWDSTKKGYTVTGTNGNSIFLPAAGYRSNSSLLNEGTYGYYWSSSLYEKRPNGAYVLSFEGGSYSWGSSGKYYGQSVRPVQSPQYTITASANDAAYGTVTGGGTFAKGKTITLTATPNEGYVFAGWSDGNIDNPRTITVTQDLTFTAEFAGIRAASVSLGATTLELSVGASEQLTATISPANALNKNITWITTDADVATVENGLVTAVGAGVAAIGVATVDGGFVATCAVTVKAAGQTTEIQQVAANPSGVQKVLVDGVIYIVKPNGETYTVDGRKVE